MVATLSDNNRHKPRPSPIVPSKFHSNSKYRQNRAQTLYVWMNQVHLVLTDFVVEDVCSGSEEVVVLIALVYTQVN